MKVRKRSGELVDFSIDKIDIAISKALGESEDTIPYHEFGELLEHIESKVYDEMDIETLQDLIECELLKIGLRDTSKKYMNYRDEMKKVAKHGWEMTQLQKDIFNQKYRHNNETFEEFLNRVAEGNSAIKKLMKHRKFLPAGRILANRGLHKDGKKITLSNCYVITPPTDNLEAIFDVAKKLARTYSYGGGCGVDIGKLRPSGSQVNNNALTTSGSTSFMELYSTTTGIIGQKGRRGALMISLPCTHPDLEAFIDIKNDLNAVTKANISIRFSNAFYEAVESNSDFDLRFEVEDTGEVIIKTINARDVFMKFSRNNWDMAEPGQLNWSHIEDWNLLSEDDEFEFAGVNP